MASAPIQSKLTSFWNHPAGPKTIFFWAPAFKWGLVIAGIKDLSRPAEKLSFTQNLALSATGLIWIRYSFVITPVNYSLASVNTFVAATGLTQLYRIWDYGRKNPTTTTTQLSSWLFRVWSSRAERSNDENGWGDTADIFFCSKKKPRSYSLGSNPLIFLPPIKSWYDRK